MFTTQGSYACGDPYRRAINAEEYPYPPSLRDRQAILAVRIYLWVLVHRQLPHVLFRSILAISGSSIATSCSSIATSGIINCNFRFINADILVLLENFRFMLVNPVQAGTSGVPYPVPRAELVRTPAVDICSNFGGSYCPRTS